MASQKTKRVYTLFLRRLFKNVLIIAFILRGCLVFTQKLPPPVKEFKPDSVGVFLTDSVFKKTIPAQFEKQIRVALAYYPTLKQTKIMFKIKKAKSPLAAAPTFWSAFRRPSKRTYIVTISSESSVPFLNKILLDSLGFNAQIGVLGHEISHILEFNSKNSLFFVGLVLRNVSKKAIDRFENNTDKRCIEQGLGYQLLAWSIEVRRNLKIKEWRGADNLGEQKRERYMSPPTILGLINY
jgi:hypothetical protein